MKKISLSLLVITMLTVGGLTPTFAEKKKEDSKTESKIFKEETKDSETNSKGTEKEKVSEPKGLYDLEISEGGLETVTQDQLKELQEFSKDNLNEKDTITFDGKTYSFLNKKGLTKSQVNLLSDLDYNVPVLYSKEQLTDKGKTTSQIIINEQSTLYDLRYTPIDSKLEITLDGKKKTLTIFDRVSVDNKDSKKFLKRMSKGLEREATVFTIKTDKGLVSVFAR